jgi:hypothetical protein
MPAGANHMKKGIEILSLRLKKEREREREREI